MCTCLLEPTIVDNTCTTCGEFHLLTRRMDARESTITDVVRRYDVLRASEVAFIQGHPSSCYIQLVTISSWISYIFHTLPVML